MKTEWWRPTPLTWTMWATVTWNGLVLWLARTGTLHHDTGGDAAGNAMSHAFLELFVMAAATAVGFLALLFLLVRWRWARIVLMVLLGLVSCLTPMLL